MWYTCLYRYLKQLIFFCLVSGCRKVIAVILNITARWCQRGSGVMPEEHRPPMNEAQFKVDNHIQQVCVCLQPKPMNISILQLHCKYNYELK